LPEPANQDNAASKSTKTQTVAQILQKANEVKPTVQKPSKTYGEHFPDLDGSTSVTSGHQGVFQPGTVG